MKNRIHSKKDLNTYLICDEIAFTGHKLSTIRRILLCLARHQNLGLWFLKKNRRLEYRFNNRNKSPFHKLVYFLAGYRYVRWQHQYSCSIPVNAIGPGFRIWHFAQGSIIINDQAIIGTGCSISAGCCIGQAKEHAPIIGDACEICLNATVLGGIHVADRTVIGANALVLKSSEESEVTIAGSPASVISHHYAEYNRTRYGKIMQFLQSRD